MNKLRNSVQLIGRLGIDPEVKNLDSGKTLTKFSLATSDSYKNSAGEKVEDTQWHNIVAWGKGCRNRWSVPQKRKRSSTRRKAHPPQL